MLQSICVFNIRREIARGAQSCRQGEEFRHPGGDLCGLAAPHPTSGSLGWEGCVQHSC